MREFRAMIAGSGEVLLEHVEPAYTVWERFRGLMLRRELPPGQGLLIPDCASVHTFFMRFPIDLVYLSKDNRVVRIVPALKPWRTSWCLGHGARSVLEMPAGWAEQKGLKEGRTVLFDFAQDPAAEERPERVPTQ